jgi:hypothetical protein
LLSPAAHLPGRRAAGEKTVQKRHHDRDASRHIPVHNKAVHVVFADLQLVGRWAAAYAKPGVRFPPARSAHLRRAVLVNPQKEHAKALVIGPDEALKLPTGAQALAADGALHDPRQHATRQAANPSLHHFSAGS